MDILATEKAIDLETSNLGLPAVIQAGATAQSRAIRALGNDALAVAAKLSTAGTVRLRLYLDAAGTVEKLATDADVLTANTRREVQVTSASPFRSFRVELANTSAGPASVLELAVAM